MDNKFELSDRDWYEMDYLTPLEDQVKCGDLLISTEMFMFNTLHSGQKDINVSVDKLDSLDEKDFTIIKAHDNMVKMKDDFDANEDNWWFEPEGRIFIKRKNVEFVLMSVPNFAINTVEKLGGSIVDSSAKRDKDE